MNLLLSNTQNIISFGIIENWADNVCLDTVLVARDGEVRVNFAVLQMFNTWLRDLWHPGETVILLPDYTVAEVKEFAQKLYASLCDIKSDISIEPDSDHNNNASRDDYDIDDNVQSDISANDQDNSINAANSTFKCEVCLKEFKDKRSLTSHKQYHSQETVYCDICGFKADNKTNLRNHKVNHSVKTCLFCYQTVSAKNYKRHVDKCTNDLKENPTYSCEQCSYQTNQKSNYDRHVKGHQPKKKYPCDVCGKQFVKESKYLEHMDKMHQVRTKPKFTCPIDLCEFGTDRKYNMEVHILNIHVNKKQSKPKSTTCDLCEKKFKSTSLKNRHQKSCKGPVTRKPLDAEAVIEMLNVNMSFSMIEKNLKLIRDYLGKDMIQPNVMKKVRRYVAYMERFFVTERIELENKVGKMHSTYVSYVRNIEELIQILITGRKVKEPALCGASHLNLL